MVPVAESSIGAVTVKVAAAPLSKSTVWLMLPVPDAVSQLPVPEVMAQVQLTLGTLK